VDAASAARCWVDREHDLRISLMLILRYFLV
jgi:hypothetical protein